MSSTTQDLKTPPAPWKSQFLSHISKLRPVTFVLSDLHTAPEGSAVPYVPRARTCIFRGMWAELPENKHNDAPKNERVYESDMPTFTTDVRMQKVPELFASGPGHGDASQSQGSGGGGPLEAIWWVEETQWQWRMKGTGWIIAPDIDEEGNEASSGVRTVKSEVGCRMRVVRDGGVPEWSWSKELTAHFGNCSPAIRGSFKNPPPGTPVANHQDSRLSLGQKVSDLHDPIARSNFRVVIIRPDEVEGLDLSDPEKARRWKYTFVKEKIEGEDRGIWRQEELWP